MPRKPRGLSFSTGNSKDAAQVSPRKRWRRVVRRSRCQQTTAGWMCFFVNGARLTVPHADGKEPDKSAPEFWNRLFRNNLDGTFSDVTVEYGLQGRGYGMGVAAGDYDNDGGRRSLRCEFRNRGAPLVRPVSQRVWQEITSTSTEQSGIATTGWTTSAGFPGTTITTEIWICFVLPLCEVELLPSITTAGSTTPAGRSAGRSYCHPDTFEPTYNFPLPQTTAMGTFHRREWSPLEY